MVNFRYHLVSITAVFLVLAALAAMTAAVAVSQVGRAYGALVRDQWNDFLFWLSSIF